MREVNRKVTARELNFRIWEYWNVGERRIAALGGTADRRPAVDPTALLLHRCYDKESRYFANAKRLVHCKISSFA